MKKQVIVIGTILMLMSGCTSPTKEEARETTLQSETTKQESEIKQLTLDEAFKKIDDKEKFVFMVTQSTCSYCNTFKKTLVPFLREHKNIPFYEIEMDMLGSMKADTNKNFEKLQKKVSEFTGGTPEMFCFEDGKMKKSASGELSEIALKNFMIDGGFIEGDKQEEIAAPTFEFKTSEYIIDSSMIDIAKKLTNKESFYLMINEYDRYNQAFIDTVIPILKEKEVEVFSLNFSTQTQGDETAMNEAYEVIMKVVSDLQMTPTLYEIEAGTAKKLIEDNVDIETIQKIAFDTSK